MKITAGLGHVEDYPAYVHAGADEVFCGYVPDQWYEKYGMQSPLNRREVKYAHVQIGGRNQLKILHSMVEDQGAPVVLTFNALTYQPEQYPILAELMEQCAADGFSDFILADVALILYLKAYGPQVHIHLSGESCILNHEAFALFDSPDICRMIFPRHLSLNEIKEWIQSSCHPGLEFEAFALNERCHFHGGLCTTLHCDSLAPMCRVPYRLSGSNDWKEDTESDAQDASMLGGTGCGLCALYDLSCSGITHLKVVGRGNSSDFMLRDLQALSKAVRYAQEVPTREEFLHAVRAMFPSGCSKNCYYHIQ